ncbi:MAG: FtsX-like permease family protein [bacterium]|nr:FtsX-like permease family protein [bacterium]
MSALDALRLAATALLGRRWRSVLSLVGLSIGVTAVVLLTALGAGAQDFVERQFRSLGTDVLAIVPGKVETSGALPGFGGVPNDLTLADAAALRDRVAGVRSAAPLVIGNDTVASGARSRQVVVIGATAEYRGVREFELRAGTFLPEGEWARGKPVVVLGSKLARELFPDRAAVGARVRVGAWRLRVVGTIASQGVHFGIDMDQVVFVPTSMALRMFDRSSLNRVALRVLPGADADRVSDAVTELLVERHSEEDFTITTPDAIMETTGRIVGMLSLAVAGIAAISMVVAGIGIMNVMLVSVSERTAEIGLLKAVGAAPRQILGVFLAEALALSFAGGAIGIGAGLLGARVLAALYPAIAGDPPAWALAASFALALFVGTLFGVLPARRAVQLDPVAALAKR